MITMRKFLLTLFSLALMAGAVFAQDYSDLNGKKALKKAARLLSQYNLDQTNSGDKLSEAKNIIDYAVKQDDIKEDPKLWVTMGDIYNALTSHDMLMAVTDPSYKAKNQNAGLMAFQAYKKCLEMDPGNKGSLSGLNEAVGSISNSGLALYEAQDYMGAFNAFRSVLDIHTLLKESGAASPLDAEADYDNQIYVTALSALNAEQLGTACSYFKTLYDKKYDKPLVYDAMYKCTVDEDLDKAAGYLSEGRERYPDDTGLLFGEINHYLKLNKIEELESKLKEAISKEPDNHTLYSTLGNTYDNLYQNASKEGDEEKAQKYFDLAKDYYEQALEKKSDYTDAIYSIGALYYNKAAVMTTEMNKLTNDFSKEGTKRYTELKEQVDGMFDEALPYFTQVEKMDPSDRNTLIALKEIFARKNDFEKSTEFKNRLEKVEAGEKIEKSYFQ